MNVQFNIDAVRGSASAPVTGRAREHCLFLLTPSREECGVESFARLLVSALQRDYPDDGYAVLAVSSRWRDLPAAFRKIAAADQVVFSVPLVAWKRLLLLPLALEDGTVVRNPVSPPEVDLELEFARVRGEGRRSSRAGGGGVLLACS